MSLFRQEEFTVEERQQEEFTIEERRRLLNKVVIHYYIESKDEVTSPLDFLNKVRTTTINFLKEKPKNKVQISLIWEMSKLDPATGNIISEELSSFNSKQESVFNSTDLEIMYERMITKVLEAFSTYLKNGSGWTLKRVVRLDITLSKLNPVKGSSYTGLSKSLKTRKALINMKNDDQACFKWAVTRALNPIDSHPERISKSLREQSKELNLEGIE